MGTTHRHFDQYSGGQHCRGYRDGNHRGVPVHPDRADRGGGQHWPYLWLVDAPRLLRDNSVIPENIRRVFHTRLAGRQQQPFWPERNWPQSRTSCRRASPSTISRPVRSSRSSACISPAPTRRSKRAARALKGELAPSWVLDRIRRVAKDQGEDIVAVEMTVTADSRLISRTLASSGIADLYGGSRCWASTGRTGYWANATPIPRRAIFASSKGTCCW